MQHPDFEKTYQQYSDLVYHLCMTYLGVSEDAEEVFQDVFLKVNDGLSQFRGEAQLKTWIYRIACNACIDELRKRKRRRFFSTYLKVGAEELPSNGRSPEELMESEEREAHIHLLLDQLPPNQKMALLLKSMEGFKQKEIAEMMNIKEKAVESLLSRARKNLKEYLKQNEGLQ